MITVTVTVNGKEHQLAGDMSVADLVEQMGMADQPVAVELNREVVPRRQHQATAINDGDVIEMVTLVGGG